MKSVINFDIIILVVSSLKKCTFNTKFVCTVFMISKLLNVYKLLNATVRKKLLSTLTNPLKLIHPNYINKST